MNYPVYMCVCVKITQRYISPYYYNVDEFQASGLWHPLINLNAFCGTVLISFNL
jgi:hypothetical protein